jgi:hypothetical protein
MEILVVLPFVAVAIVAIPPLVALVRLWNSLRF